MSRSVVWKEGLVMDALDYQDVAEYAIDLSDFLSDAAITGAASVGTEITINSTAFTGQVITITVSAGTLKTVAKVRFQVTTATETHNRSFNIPIKSL
tara:strand:+ start:344 stop:634 length:291 start_codon:yes stop_codon:yes gene_type:complete